MGTTQSKTTRKDGYRSLLTQAVKKYDTMIQKNIAYEDYGRLSDKKAARVASDAYAKIITKIDKYEIEHGLGTNLNRSNRRYGPTNYWRIVHGHFYEE